MTKGRGQNYPEFTEIKKCQSIALFLSEMTFYFSYHNTNESIKKSFDLKYFFISPMVTHVGCLLYSNCANFKEPNDGRRRVQHVYE